MTNKPKEIKLTPSALRNLLNERHGGKFYGEGAKKRVLGKFTLQDVQNYITAGQLPKKYGGEKLERREDKVQNMSFVYLT